jgi:hypothetical protein
MSTLVGLRPYLASYLSPVPPNETIRAWLNTGGVRRFKANPSARRGGGAVYYSVADVERFLKNRAELRGPLPPVRSKPKSDRLSTASATTSTSGTEYAALCDDFRESTPGKGPQPLPGADRPSGKGVAL